MIDPSTLKDFRRSWKSSNCPLQLLISQSMLPEHTQRHFGQLASYCEGFASRLIWLIGIIRYWSMNALGPWLCPNQAWKVFSNYIKFKSICFSGRQTIPDLPIPTAKTHNRTTFFLNKGVAPRWLIWKLKKTRQFLFLCGKKYSPWTSIALPSALMVKKHTYPFWRWHQSPITHFPSKTHIQTTFFSTKVSPPLVLLIENLKTR